MTRPHVVVVGAYGSAGVAAAEVLADADVELTLVDDGDPGGGLCILRGCMPSKEVLSAAAHRYQTRHDHRLTGDPPAVDLDAVVETKDDHVLGFAEHRRAAVHDLAERENVTFHHETAEFVDDCVLDVGGERVDADYVVVATGSDLNVPDLPGLGDVDWMGSRDVLDATDFPDSGVVMGFGYVGLELVPYLSEAAGMDITVIEHDDRPLDDYHRSFGEELLDMYREEFGVDVRTEVYEERVEPTTDGGVRLHLEDGTTAEGDQLFLFTGRRPSYPDGLDATSLDPWPDWVQGTLQSVDDERVFVVGDANGERMLLHNAKEEGYLAGRNVLHSEVGEELERYDPLPHKVLFSGTGVYPFASLGLTAPEAREVGRDVVTAQRDATDDGVFKTKDAPRGTARLVVDADDGTVLGYHGLHYHADVMAKTMQVVLEAGMDVREIPDRAYHPTTPEILDGLFRETADQL
ncbi:dihydrolipoyl dehydrogenase family protein [Halobacterium bonnevillei]|uniref:FAD-dependent oxidoreductase n=1 Tax=Halobacterium bonnevillei TaxID=2692200 RepID=A0A6B0SNH0_9EURY|nr:NAD(P)/FAD-dependent oxidoreductase [Halobacterium bonnevillei]MXR22036.1 FAD-dependent oxidoreductase [Halobacterium bonnevillei]